MARRSFPSTMLPVTMVFALCILMLAFNAVRSSPKNEGLRQTCYAFQRDLNIAYMEVITNKIQTDSLMKCSQDPANTRSVSRVAYPEAMSYAIDQVNSRSDLLPNISLGFAVVDFCYSDLTGLGLSTYLLPDQNDTDYFPDGELITCNNGYRRFRNIVGTIGPGYSRLAVMNGGLFSVFHLPSVLTFATSNDLSDKSRFPYTMRLVPPDSFQADALTDLLLHFGWTYAALLYQEGPYGENGAKQVQRNAKAKGICLAFSYMFRTVPTPDIAREAVDKLIEYRKARAVILFLNPNDVRELGKELIRREETGYYIMVASDSFLLRDEYAKAYDGAFAVRFSVAQSGTFRHHYNSLTLQGSSNPWLPGIWERQHNCSWRGNAGRRSCNAFKDTPTIPPINVNTYPEMILDGVSVYAHALHALIADNCPEAFLNKIHLTKCIKGPLLLKYLRNTSISGFLGPIQFDENGDFKGSYDLRQFHYSPLGSVIGAVWSRLSETLTVHTDRLKWFSHTQNNAIIKSLPESVCSKSCKPKEYYIQKELVCCWDCRQCRNNEVLIQNKTGCEVCDELTWPDEETITFCILIDPTILKWTDPVTLSLAGVASLGIFGCIITSLIFIKNRKAKIIKASSQQLMAIILSGMALAYTTALAFLFEPSRISCYICRFGFNLAVSLIYGPLVVKTSRIYRIFESGKRGTKAPHLIGTRSQIVMVIIVIGIQILLCVVSMLLDFPVPLARMPVRTEKYVEVLCSLPLIALLPPLSFNLILIVFCAAFGFMTRKLPENFNESWYIFVSVATTTFLWLVFLPAYFTAFYATHQVVLLASCLLINGTVTLMCLYTPKIYCIYYVDNTTIKFQTAGTTTTTVDTT